MEKEIYIIHYKGEYHTLPNEEIPQKEEHVSNVAGVFNNQEKAIAFLFAFHKDNSLPYKNRFIKFMQTEDGSISGTSRRTYIDEVSCISQTEEIKLSTFGIENPEYDTNEIAQLWA